MKNECEPESAEDDEAGYSEVLAAYHESLLSGASDDFNSNVTPQLSGAIDCLKMMERHRQLGAAVDSSVETGEWPARQPPLKSSIQKNVSGRIGRFEVIRTLGAGGSGIVLLALDPKLDRQIALKVPTPESLLREEFIMRFQREAKIAASLQHPNIVGILETGAVGPIHYIASEYCNGPNFDEWIKNRSEPLKPIAAAQMMHSLASAIQHAHSRGILHRDIKPANILFQLKDGETVDSIPDSQLADCVRLADFGLAKSLADSVHLTTAAAILGTPAYMSPEQASGEDGQTGTHSDIFSLGVVLYELLTGVSPFARDSSIATLNAVRQDLPQSVSNSKHGCPIDLAAICDKCLEKRPADRYPTAAGLLDDLENFIEGRPVTARRISTAGRVWRWALNNPLLATLGATVGLMFTALAIGSTTAAVLLNNSRQEVIEALANEKAAHQLAENNATNALKETYAARLAQAKATRLSGRIGQRNESLASLDQAAQVMQKLTFHEDESLQHETLKLRNEIIASLSLMDVSLAQTWHKPESTEPFENPRNVRADATGNRIAVVSEDGATVTILDANNQSILQTLTMADKDEAIGAIAFSNDGRFLALCCQTDTLTNQGQLLDLQESRMVAQFTVARPPYSIAMANSCPFDFSPDSKTLAVCSSKKSLQILDVQDGGKPLKQVRLNHFVNLVRYSKDAKYLAVGGPKSIIILESADITKAPTQEIPLGRASRLSQMEWSPEGNQLAVASLPHACNVFNPIRGTHLFNLVGHKAPIEDIAFHQKYGLMITGSVDGSTTLWSRAMGHRVLTLEGQATHFTADGQSIATRTGRYTIQKPARHIIAGATRDTKAVAAGDWHSTVADWGALENPVSVHPNGRLMIKADGRKIGFTDLGQHQEIAAFPWNVEHCLFSGSGDAILLRNRAGRFEQMPIAIDETDTEIKVRVGLPQPLEISPFPGSFSRPPGIPDRFLIAEVRPNEVIFADRLEQKIYAIQTRGGTVWADISPNGQFVAISHASRDMNLYNAATGEHLKQFKDSVGRTAFHPDGQTMVLTSGNGCQFYRTNDHGISWNIIHSTTTVSRPPIVVPIGGDPAAYNGDGSLVAVRGRGTVDLLNTTTFATLASFEMPAIYMVRSLWVSHAGNYLMASPANAPRGVWNLNLYRDALKQRNLDWPAPPTPPAFIPEANPPIRIIWSDTE